MKEIKGVDLIILFISFIPFIPVKFLLRSQGGERFAEQHVKARRDTDHGHQKRSYQHARRGKHGVELPLDLHQIFTYDK